MILRMFGRRMLWARQDLEFHAVDVILSFAGGFASRDLVILGDEGPGMSKIRPVWGPVRPCDASVSFADVPEAWVYSWPHAEDGVCKG